MSFLVCCVCGEDDPARQDQLLPCTSCRAQTHTVCDGTYVFVYVYICVDEWMDRWMNGLADRCILICLFVLMYVLMFCLFEALFSNETYLSSVNILYLR